MASKVMSYIYVAVVFAIIGSIILIAGPSLPLPSLIPLAIGMVCFFIVIVTLIAALCLHQRDKEVEET